MEKTEESNPSENEGIRQPSSEENTFQELKELTADNSSGEAPNKANEEYIHPERISNEVLLTKTTYDVDQEEKQAESKEENTKVVFVVVIVFEFPKVLNILKEAFEKSILIIKFLKYFFFTNRFN